MKCIFCSIARGEEPAYILYDKQGILVFLDIYPVERGHLLVVPKEHYESSADIDICTASRVFATATVLSKIYMNKLGAPGVNILLNSGQPAGQEILHFHVHVIPRWRGGGWRGLFSRYRLGSEEAEEVLSDLKPYTLYIDQAVMNIECNRSS